MDRSKLGRREVGVPPWTHCDVELPDGLCTAIRATVPTDAESAAYDRCLAHLDGEELQRVIDHSGPGADLDLRGTRVSGELLRRLIEAATDTQGRPHFGTALCQNAVFDHEADFRGARFMGRANFARARFPEGANFGAAEFTSTAIFADAEFGKLAVFDRATFGDEAFFGARFIDAYFHHATFRDIAAFGGATFAAEALFDWAAFHGPAEFNEAVMRDEVVFNNVTFERGASFEQVMIARKAEFMGAVFKGRARFNDAQFALCGLFDGTVFEDDLELGAMFDGFVRLTDAVVKGALTGELAAQAVQIGHTVFHEQVSLQITAVEAAFRDTRFEARTDLWLCGAAVDLSRALFAEPTVIAGTPGPLLESHEDTVRRERRSSRTQNRLAGDEPLRERSELVREMLAEAAGETPVLWTPAITSLEGADVGELTLVDIDLSYCRFAGAHRLDQIAVEGERWFLPAPRLRARRRVLAEEYAWRAGRTGVPWSRTTLAAQEGPEEQQAEVGPARLADLYRQLRKAFEEAKNQPGAADFYYGEMEMRRHTADTPLDERLILHLYWAVSGYGLRASRALACLAMLVMTAAALLLLIPEPVNLAQTLLFTSGATLSLEPGIEGWPAILPYWGEVLRIGLRIAGPVFLGLAALAIRGRVKR